MQNKTKMRRRGKTKSLRAGAAPGLRRSGTRRTRHPAEKGDFSALQHFILHRTISAGLRLPHNAKGRGGISATAPALPRTILMQRTMAMRRAGGG
jgi:hypothetical protein